MGHDFLPGDWAEVRFRVHVDPTGHWAADLSIRERYLPDVPLIPIASGDSMKPVSESELEDILAAVATYAAWAIRHTTEPF